MKYLIIIGFLLIVGAYLCWKWSYDNEVLEGKITSMDYVPYKEWTTTRMQQMGKVSIPVTDHHKKEEHYVLTIDGIARNGKRNTNTIEIPVKDKDLYKVGGDWYKKQ